MIDPAPVAKHAAEFIDSLEREFGDDATLVRVAFVAEVTHHDDVSTVRLSIRDYEFPASATVRAGLLSRAAAATVWGETIED